MTEGMTRLVEWSALITEWLGIMTIVLGAVAAMFVVIARAGRDVKSWYPLYRRYFGHAILLGLEFLVAADIIRTVSHEPTFDNVIVLGLVVLIRTFLSFTLGAELEGHWPWEKARVEREELRPPTPPHA